MKRVLFLICFCCLIAASKAQILRIATSASTISAQIPGYSQVSTYNIKSYNYTPSVPQNPPTPVDEDSTTEDHKLYNYGDNLSVSITTADGNITTTSAGKVWTLKISIPNALNIGVRFNLFNLSSLAEMYIFNESKTVLDSCIKKAHFTNSNIIGIGPLKDNSIIIYIVERNNTGAFQSTISINNIIAGFQELSEVGSIGGVNARPSINCDPLVQCQQGKITFARAVARFNSNGFQGTGTLINNEAANGRAYFLTAFHLIDVNRDFLGRPSGNGVIDQDEIVALAGATIQFQYWRTTCNGTINNAFLEFSGAIVRASWRNSDVVLLELTNPPGIGDLVNYAGWNRQIGSPSSSSSFIIHHPQGEDMRITTTRNVNTWIWNTNYWTAHYSSGTVDRGSSGSALMNEFGQIVGQLRSGWSSCNFTDFGDRYGKFERSWNGAGLQTWLSPVQGLQSSQLLNLTQIPINGPSNVACTIPGTFSTLPNLLDVTYTWSVTSGMQINSGQGTATVNISSINSSVTSGTLTLTLASPTKGRTRVYAVSKQIVFGPPQISLTSTAGTCSGQYQQWNIVNNTPTYGSNWSWTVGSLNPNSQITINSPNSPSTTLSVKGGGSVRLNYRDVCGINQVTGVTVYSTCTGFAIAVSPNPSQSNLNVTLSTIDANSESLVSSAQNNTISMLDSKGKTILSLYDVNTNALIKQWKYNEIKNQTYNLNITGLKSGIYVLQVDRDGQAGVIKVVVE